jgi:hypothetical protein
MAEDNDTSPPADKSLGPLPEGEKVRVFHSYSHKDERLRNEIDEHLAVLKHEGLIEPWHDRRIGAGTEWKDQIDDNLERAHLVLLLVSSHFLASNYCYDVEMKRALERHDAGQVRVIPIILRPCDWEKSPFGRLQAIPTDGKAITDWHNRDKALAEVARTIRQVVEQLRNAAPNISDQPDAHQGNAKPEHPTEAAGASEKQAIETVIGQTGNGVAAEVAELIETLSAVQRSKRSWAASRRTIALFTVAVVVTIGLVVMAIWLARRGPVPQTPVVEIERVEAKLWTGDLWVTVYFQARNVEDCELSVAIATDKNFRSDSIIRELEIPEAHKRGPSATVVAQKAGGMRSGYVQVQATPERGAPVLETAPFSVSSE